MQSRTSRGIAAIATTLVVMSPLMSPMSVFAGTTTTVSQYVVQQTPTGYSITAKDSSGNVVTTATSAYVSYSVTDGASSDSDSDTMSLPTLTAPDTSGSTITISTNGTPTQIPLTNGVANIAASGQPAESGTADNDWVSTIKVEDSSTATTSTAFGSLQQTSFNPSASKVSVSPSQGSSFVAGTNNVTFQVLLDNGSGQPVPGLGVNDFSIVSSLSGATVQITKVAYDSTSGNYTLTATDTTPGGQGFTVSANGFTVGSPTANVNIQPASAYLDPSTPTPIAPIDKNILLDVELPTGSSTTLKASDFGVSSDATGATPIVNSAIYNSSTGLYQLTVSDLTVGTQNLTVAVPSISFSSPLIPVTVSQLPASLGGIQVSPLLGATVGSSTEFDVFNLPTNTTDPVYYVVQVTDATGTPVSSSTAQLAVDNSTDVITALATETYSIDEQSGTTVPTSGYYNFGLTFSTAGQYNVTFAMVDQASNQIIGSSTMPVQAGQGNTIITLDDASGNPVTGGVVEVMPSTSSTSTGTGSGSTAMPDTLQTVDANQPVYLPAGDYVVTQAYDPTMNQWIQVSPAQTLTVDATNGGKVTIQIPQMGTLTGTITTGGTAPGVPGDLTLFPVTSAGTPDYTQVPMDVQVDATGAINQDLPVGNYYATTYSLQQTSPSTSGSSTSSTGPTGLFTVNQPVSITQGKTTTVTWQTQSLSLYGPPSATTGMQQWFSSLVSSTVQLPQSVYYQLSVSTGGSPASGVTGEIWTASGPQTFSVKSGSATLEKTNPLSGQDAGNTSFALTFATAGTYNVEMNIVDAATDKVVASGTQLLQVNQANVSGTLFAADGKTPVPYSAVTLTGPNSATQQLQTDSEGKFAAYLTPGQWTITQVQDWSVDQNAYTLPTTITIQVGGQAQSGIAVTDPELNVTGTAESYNGTSLVPLANGYVQITDASGQSYGASTDANGEFALKLSPGTYTATYEYGPTSSIQVNTSFTVASDGTVSPSPLVVAPQAPDFNLTVEGPSGKPLTTGEVGILTQSDYNSGNYQNATWYNVTSSGTISGYLQKGTYVAFTEWDGKNSTPMNSTFTITDPTQLLTTPTLGPVEPNLTGTLTQEGAPVPGATIQIAPSGSTDPSQDIYLGTDGNGNFTSFQLTSSGAQDLLTNGTKYTVVGLWTSSGWVPMNQSFTAAPGETLNLQVPGADLTGTVSVDGTSITSGWIAFGPSGTIDTTGQKWLWEPITNGSYSAILPTGSYQVYAIQDSSGKYYDETQRAQTPISITDTSQAQQDNVSIANDFTGQLVTTGNTPVGNATLELSQNPNPTTSADWNQVQYVNVDANGNFSSELPAGTWYVLGVWDQNTQAYTQLGTEVTISDTSPQPVTISMAPNVSGTITWTGTAPTAHNAWLVVQDTSNTSSVFGIPLNPSTWDYSANLPTGANGKTYQVLGIDVQDNSGNQSWIDLSELGLTNISVTAGQSTQANFSVGSTTGTVSGITSGLTGYVVFQNKTDSSKYTSVGFDGNGNLQTNSLTSADWNPVAIEVGTTYYSVASFTDTTGWQITAGAAQ